MIDAFLSAGWVTIDTARCYSDGACEEMIGRCLHDASKGRAVKIDSKVNPAIGRGLSREGVREQLSATLQALRVEAINVLYLHQPDTRNDLTAALESAHELVKQGLVLQLGLSNFSALETQRCIAVCKEHGWTQPTVYQGIYNAANRWVEDELLPILRANHIRFLAYSPLAGGLLCKRHNRAELPQKRVADNPFYFNDACLDANSKIADACLAYELDMLHATYSWLLHHSALTQRDGIVIGASSLDQLQPNLAACASSCKLPETVAEAFNSAWSMCRYTAYPYWRLYSRDMPDREELVRNAPGALFHCQ
eukprot:TRINITY_DN102571_c0_g1_i1.p1 TRINITY_DN102571_c0_g1~~TRINITY_DN102571_c0_g1_i1.p1  ORF type:complete len:361 (+),score=49.62 TRINITY_DN102571_c0_g1_i1:159-1085(+)